jgi:hypothetical protein
VADNWQQVIPLETEDPDLRTRRSVDMVALVCGIVFSLLAVLLMTGVDVSLGIFSDGGLLWILLIGAGVALLASELRKAARRGDRDR